MNCKKCKYRHPPDEFGSVSCETEFDYPITTACELFTDEELTGDPEP